MSTGLIVIVAAVVVVPLLMVVVFKSFWKVPKADEALIITGAGVGKGGEGRAYKIVTGSGALVVPVFQHASFLSMAAQVVSIEVVGVDSQKIPIGVNGSVVYKVGDDEQSITNAATRFLDSQNPERGQNVSQMHSLVREVTHGHLRSIMGGMTVEDLIANRNALAEETREACGVDMGRLGLVIDSLQIQDLQDPTGYIKALGEPRTAAVKREARIAAAAADREATEREQEAARLVAAANRDTEVAEAEYEATAEQARAKSEQAAPLATAEARQEVVKRETAVAVLEAQREETRLVATVNKPADAAAYQMRVEAEADASAQVARAEAAARERTLVGTAQAEVTAATGTAEAAAIRAKALAEADGIARRAEALREQSEAVVAQTVAEKFPEVVEAAAGAFKGIDQMIVLNGAQGIGEIMAQVVGTAGPLLQTVRETLGANGSPHTNGDRQEDGYTVPVE